MAWSHRKCRGRDSNYLSCRNVFRKQSVDIFYVSLRSTNCVIYSNIIIAICCCALARSNEFSIPQVDMEQDHQIKCVHTRCIAGEYIARKVEIVSCKLKIIYSIIAFAVSYSTVYVCACLQRTIDNANDGIQIKWLRAIICKGWKTKVGARKKAKTIAHKLLTVWNFHIWKMNGIIINKRKYVSVHIWAEHIYTMWAKCNCMTKRWTERMKKKNSKKTSLHIQSVQKMTYKHIGTHSPIYICLYTCNCTLCTNNAALRVWYRTKKSFFLCANKNGSRREAENVNWYRHTYIINGKIVFAHNELEHIYFY